MLQELHGELEPVIRSLYAASNHLCRSSSYKQQPLNHLPSLYPPTTTYTRLFQLSIFLCSAILTLLLIFSRRFLSPLYTGLLSTGLFTRRYRHDCRVTLSDARFHPLCLKIFLRESDRLTFQLSHKPREWRSRNIELQSHGKSQFTLYTVHMHRG